MRPSSLASAASRICSPAVSRRWSTFSSRWSGTTSRGFGGGSVGSDCWAAAAPGAASAASTSSLKRERGIFLLPWGRGCQCAALGQVPAGPSDVEVARLRMVQDDGAGALLGPELVLVGQLDADPGGTQQLQQRRLIGEVGAGRVAEAVARAAVALLEQLAHLPGVVVAEPELGPDLAVDVLGQGLSQLDPQPVQPDIVLVAVGGEPVAGDLGRALADGDHLQ